MPAHALNLGDEAAATGAKAAIATAIQLPDGDEDKMPKTGTLTPDELETLVEWAEQ